MTTKDKRTKALNSLPDQMSPEEIARAIFRDADRKRKARLAAKEKKG